MEWKEVRLGDLLTEKGYIRGPFGSALKRGEMQTEGIPVYEQQHAIYNSRSFRFYVDDKKFEEMKRFQVQSDDLIISCSGTVGEVSLISDNDPKGIISQALLDLRVDKSLILPSYLYYFFKTPHGHNSIIERSSGSVQVNIAKRKVIEDISVMLPPLAVQTRIASILSSLDRKIELNNKINAQLEEMAQAIFKSWFVDFEPFKDGKFVESELGMIPEGFEACRLGDVCKCLLGGTPSRNNEDFWGGDINWINSGAVNEFRIIEPSEKITELGLCKSATKLLPTKTTVLAITGATLGQVSLLEIPTCANQSVIGVTESSSIKHGLIYPLISLKIKELIMHQTGGAQQHINKQNVEDLQFVLPPAKILEWYYEKVHPLYSEISTLCFENLHLSQLRDTLLPRLMSGEIDLDEIEKTI